MRKPFSGPSREAIEREEDYGAPRIDREVSKRRFATDAINNGAGTAVRSPTLSQEEMHVFASVILRDRLSPSEGKTRKPTENITGRFRGSRYLVRLSGDDRTDF